MVQTDTGVGPVEMVRSQRQEARSIGLHALAAAGMYVSPLLLFVPAAFISSGLRHGRRGLIGAIAGSAIILAVGTWILGSASFSVRELTGILRLILTIGIPAAIITGMIRRSSGLGPILLTALLLSVGGFVLVEGLMRASASFSPYQAIVAEFDAASQPTLEFYRRAGVGEQTLEAMTRISRTMVGTFVPAILTIITALMFVFSLVMIPRLPWGRSAAPSLLFRNFRLPDVFLFGFVAGGISPLLGGTARTIGLNLLVVVGFLYLLQGLAIFRAIVLRAGFGPVGNLIAWALLLLMALNGIAAFVLFLAGLFDSFFDFRKPRKKGESNESDSD